MNPKISVITISYNNREGLEKTIKSVVSQDNNDYEYIVIDGGSEDGSKELLEKYAEHISYGICESDKGIYNAMNKGIQAAHGEYLIFLNSGDQFYDSKSLSNGAKYLGNEDLVYGDLEIVNNDKSFIKKYPKDLSFQHFYYQSLPHPSTFIKKTAFERFGLYDESFKIISDWKWFLMAVCTHNCSFKHIDHTISTFYMDGISSVKGNEKKIWAEKNAVFEKYYPRIIGDIRALLALQGEKSKIKRYKILQFLDALKIIKLPK